MPPPKDSPLRRAKRSVAEASRVWKGAPSGRERDLLLEVDRQREAYLQLMLKCLVGTIYRDPPLRDADAKGYDPKAREYGWDWPSSALSMIGVKRMQNVRDLVESVVGEKVPGDLIETGVWRGGACIYMRAVLQTYGVRDRKVWVADSFEGLPPPDAAKYPHDDGDTFHTYRELAVTIDDVKENFARFGLLDAQVEFLKGWFKDTLPKAPIEKLALMRLDGDMYESTMDALAALYPKLSRGGYVIIDDYRVVKACAQAVEDFRREHRITDELREIDGVGIFWRRS